MFPDVSMLVVEEGEHPMPANGPHAMEGLLAHPAYAGVSEPCEGGGDNPGAHNHPE